MEIENLRCNSCPGIKGKQIESDPEFGKIETRAEITLIGCHK